MNNLPFYVAYNVVLGIVARSGIYCINSKWHEVLHILHLFLSLQTTLWSILHNCQCHQDNCQFHSYTFSMWHDRMVQMSAKSKGTAYKSRLGRSRWRILWWLLPRRPQGHCAVSRQSSLGLIQVAHFSTLLTTSSFPFYVTLCVIYFDSVCWLCSKYISVYFLLLYRLQRPTQLAVGKIQHFFRQVVRCISFFCTLKYQCIMRNCAGWELLFKQLNSVRKTLVSGQLCCSNSWKTSVKDLLWLFLY